MKAYKVVARVQYSYGDMLLSSDRTFAASSVEYKLNEWTQPNNEYANSYLFCFKDLKSARSYINNIYLYSRRLPFEIYECEIKQTLKKGCFTRCFDEFNMLWNKVSKQIKNHSKIEQPKVYEGTIWAKYVKLLKKID